MCWRGREVASSRSAGHFFILEAIDPDYCCPVLQARFEAADPALLQAVIGAQADDDPELRYTYVLDEAELATVVSAFGVRFDPTPLGHADPQIELSRLHPIQEGPYLVHTGYELFLLLDGRKKLARMGDCYPPLAFDGEERFDYWVADGKLHREEVLKPFDAPISEYLGTRTVYYTPVGEEWRIQAMELIFRAAAKSGGWNEHFERLEGMLFGYEDWQNDWWIEAGRQRGGFGGISLFSTVTADGLIWLQSAGFRALPPIDKANVTVASFDSNDAAALRNLMLEDFDNAAVICFKIFPQQLYDLVGGAGRGPWLLPRDRIPDLNRLLRNGVVVAARRDDPA